MSGSDDAANASRVLSGNENVPVFCGWKSRPALVFVVCMIPMRRSAGFSTYVESARMAESPPSKLIATPNILAEVLAMKSETSCGGETPLSTHQTTGSYPLSTSYIIARLLMTLPPSPESERRKLQEFRKKVVSRTASLVAFTTVDPIALKDGTSVANPTPSASKRRISSVSPRAPAWPMACSKKKCDVEESDLPAAVTPLVRFSHRNVPLRSPNGEGCPVVGVVE